MIFNKNNCHAMQEMTLAEGKEAIKVALVGNPNCGKTTLFNALTGSRQHVGNWPGVTVEKKCGFFTAQNKLIEVVDLPGVYSLIQASEAGALDEKIASEFILSQSADVIVNIVDASNLERHLYLTLQLLEMGVPVILVLNMMDVARSQQIEVNLAKLSAKLGCPVVAVEAKNGKGIDDLKHQLIIPQKSVTFYSSYAPSVEAAITKLTQFAGPSSNKTKWLAIRLLEGDLSCAHLASPDLRKEAFALQQAIQAEANEDPDILLADARYQTIHQLMQEAIHSAKTLKTTWTARIDCIVLNRFLGLPIFLGVMYLLFFFSINIGSAFQDFFDIASQAIFVDGTAHWLNQLGAPNWLSALLANGVGKGINTTVTFIPVIGGMFLFLALLEDSGYMARAAFVVDRLMGALGLPGKSFVPMIVGFGCNVPAIMGARTLENKRDRILTIMMSPFMSCGARLAIYAVFTAAFFPQGGQNIVFALYIIGILMAILTGFILRQTLLKGEPSPLVMELPAYHMPHSKTLFIHAWQRLKGFLFRAGKLIVPICVLIGALNSINVDGSMNTGEGDTASLLSMIGRWTTPLFAPMGIQSDNWPATVGLVTGVLAKEVVVGTLNTLYTQMGQLAAASGADFNLWDSLQAALQSIPNNLAALGSALSNPILATGTPDPVNQGVYGLMFQKFDGKIGAFAYLLFVLLYFPCVSTTAAMLRELHRGWSVFSVCWMTGVAYGVAVLFYQAATWFRHPLSSSLWIILVAFAFVCTIGFIHLLAKREEKITLLKTSVQGVSA